MEAVAEAIQRLVDNGLGIDPVEMIIQIASTIVLVLVVKLFFWNKVTAFIEGRREVVDQELIEATQRNEEAKQLQEEAEQALSQVKLEAKEILDDAKSRGEDTRREIVSKAKDEATHIKKNAQKDLAQEIEVARSNIRNEIIDVATLLTQKVIDKEMNKKTYEHLLDDSIDEVTKQ